MSYKLHLPKQSDACLKATEGTGRRGWGQASLPWVEAGVRGGAASPAAAISSVSLLLQTFLVGLLSLLRWGSDGINGRRNEDIDIKENFTNGIT